jgi:aldehyde:ferredoxin oxidoreductase
MNPNGYHGTILWIDLGNRSYHVETPDENFWRLYGGGGLAATYLLLRETAPGVDPLGPENLLIFATSVVAGLNAPGLARFTTSAKSPLTGGIGETRTEGPWGPALKCSGADIIVIRGASTEPVMVEIVPGTWNGPEETATQVIFHQAESLWGKTVGAATDEIEKRLGGRVHTAAIGPAGENLVRFASIVTDRSHQASRMGMGAVMGSKRLKAVVLREGSVPAVADPEALARIGREFRRAIPENSLSKWQHDHPGFSCWIYLHGLDASICVENYSRSEFPDLQAFEETRYEDMKIVDLPCPGCPNNCIKSIRDPSDSTDDGSDYRSAGIHQEITGAMGPNLGIGDLSFILRANALCNQYGLDPTSLGFTISFAMECVREGILSESDNGGRHLRFGSTDDALRCIEDITFRRGLGDILAEGSKRAADTLGGGAPDLAMHAKGLELVPFEPRSQTNLALGYAVAPIGPRYDICEHDWDFDTEVGWDHTLRYSRTLGILERIPMGYMGPEKVRNFKALHTLWSAADALDMCIFAVAPTRILSMPVMAELLRAATGWETSSYELMRYGERRVHLMRWYNLREGLTKADDTLPTRFHTRAIEGGPQAGAVIDRQKFAESVQTFYAMMGWDEEGVPLESTLYDAGLGWLLERQKSR